MKHDNSSDDSFGDYDSDSYDASAASSSQQATSSSEIVAAPLTPEAINAYASLYFEFTLLKLRQVKALNMLNTYERSVSASSSTGTDTDDYWWETPLEAIAAIMEVISRELSAFIHNKQMTIDDTITIVQILKRRFAELSQQTYPEIAATIRKIDTPIKAPVLPKTPVTINAKRLHNSLARSATKTPRSANPDHAASLTARNLDFKDESLIAPVPAQGLEDDVIAPGPAPDSLATDVSAQPSPSHALAHTQAFASGLDTHNIHIFGEAGAYSNSTEQRFSSEAVITETEIYSNPAAQGFSSEDLTAESASELSSDTELFEIVIEASPSNLPDADENAELSVAPESDVMSAPSLSVAPENEVISAPAADNLPSASTSSERTHSRSPSPTQVGLFSAPTVGSTSSPSSSGSV